MPHGLNFTDVSAPTPTPAPVAATSVFAYFLRGKRSILQRAGGGIMLIGNCAMVGQGPSQRSFHPPRLACTPGTWAGRLLGELGLVRQEPDSHRARLMEGGIRANLAFLCSRPWPRSRHSLCTRCALPTYALSRTQEGLCEKNSYN